MKKNITTDWKAVMGQRETKLIDTFNSMQDIALISEVSREESNSLEYKLIALN